MKKKLNTTNQGNANQNHNEISSSSNQYGYYKEDNIVSADQDVEKKEACTCCQDYKLVQSLWKTVMEVLKKLKLPGCGDACL